MESDNYLTIKSSSSGLYKEKGSRFLSFAFPVVHQDEVKPIIEGIAGLCDARHHCYAYMIGRERVNWRINDDGEPSGTAGRPILGQINSSGLTNILIVVTRYFGGTLLGVSGLINAYKSAAADAIGNAEIIEKTLHEYYAIDFPYISMNDIMKIMKEEDIHQSDQSFGLECSIIIDFRVNAREKIMRRLSRVEGLTYKYIETR
ncbi:MAG: YigZ family protein [Bacteroidales bacterium]|nr:YigZ family protein [Bacteroidales bacterium]